MKKFEVYEEDKYGNTWIVAQFANLRDAEMHKSRLYGKDDSYKVRAIPERFDVV